MLWGGHIGSLELRREGEAVRVAGRFPYNDPAELGEGRTEVIAPRAFSSRITAGEDIFLLAGHDFDKPLAATGAGTLTLRDGDDALTFDATIPDGTTWARDFLAAHHAGLIRGLSPGFRVPQDGERVERQGRTIRRTIFAAELFEISVVTRPAYERAQVEARNWRPRSPDVNQSLMKIHAIDRWR